MADGPESYSDPDGFIQALLDPESITGDQDSTDDSFVSATDQPLFPVPSSIAGIKKALDANREYQRQLNKANAAIFDRYLANHQEQEKLRNEGVNPAAGILEPVSVCSIGGKKMNLSSLVSYTPYFRNQKGDVIILRSTVSKGHLKTVPQPKGWTLKEKEELKRHVIEQYFQTVTLRPLNKAYSELTKNQKNRFDLGEFLTFNAVNDDMTDEQLASRIKELEEEIQSLSECHKKSPYIPTIAESTSLDWDAIDSLHKNYFRDSDQCKQMWLLKLHPSICHDKFTPEEMNDIIKLHARHNWDFDQMAKELSEKTKKLRLPWMVASEYLRFANQKTGPLSIGESTLLEYFIQELTTDDHQIPWIDVQSLIPGRSIFQLKHHWTKKNSVKRNHSWTELEDQILCLAFYYFDRFKKTEGNKKSARRRTMKGDGDLMATAAKPLLEDKHDWKSISEYVYGRLNTQCRERYILRMSTKNLKSGSWTEEEDSLLLAKVDKYQKKFKKDFKWARLQMEGRNERQIRQRWDFLQRDNPDGRNMTRKSPYLKTSAEKILKELENKHGLDLKNRQQIMSYLNKGRKKLEEIHLKKQQKMAKFESESAGCGRKKKASTDADVDKELVDLFADNSYLDEHRKVSLNDKPLSRSIMDQLLYETAKKTVDELISGQNSVRILRSQTEALTQIIKKQFEGMIVTRVRQDNPFNAAIDEPLESEFSSCVSIKVLPPNQKSLAAFKTLVHKNQDSMDQEEVMPNIPNEEMPFFDRLKQRFTTLFWSPSFVSNVKPPFESDTKGHVEILDSDQPESGRRSSARIKHLKKSKADRREEKSKHATGMSIIRDKQKALIETAQLKTEREDGPLESKHEPSTAGMDLKQLLEHCITRKWHKGQTPRVTEKERSVKPKKTPVRAVRCGKKRKADMSDQNTVMNGGEEAILICGRVSQNDEEEFIPRKSSRPRIKKEIIDY